MIQSLEIRNLFGRFNYKIETKLGGVTIITGPNGFGKSTILKIIHYIIAGNFYYFHSLTFDSIKCIFVDGYEVDIELKGEELRVNNILVKPLSYSNLPISMRRRFEFNKKRLSFDEFEIFENDDFFEEMQKVYGTTMEYERVLEFITGEQNSNKKFIKLRDSIAKNIRKSKFISDQRIRRRSTILENDELQYKNRYDFIELPLILKRKIEEVASEYSTKANELDSSYPKRLLTSVEEIDENIYIKKLSEAREKFEKLSEYHLAELSLVEEGSFNKKYATALKIYFDDFFQKYLVFEELIMKLDLFTSILNARLQFKKIEISKDKGFVVLDNDSLNSIPLNKLSSGEKQEILLFFELIFETDQEVLLLVDEPEISLHITWQQKFLDDLLRVSKMNNLKVIVATHSPQIIGNHWDIQIDLGELYNG